MYAISLKKNVTIAQYANSRNGNYDVTSFKPFRKFKTRNEARVFKKNYKGSPITIINLETNQAVR